MVDEQLRGVRVVLLRLALAASSSRRSPASSFSPRRRRRRRRRRRPPALLLLPDSLAAAPPRLLRVPSRRRGSLESFFTNAAWRSGLDAGSAARIASTSLRGIRSVVGARSSRSSSSSSSPPPSSVAAVAAAAPLPAASSSSSPPPPLPPLDCEGVGGFAALRLPSVLARFFDAGVVVVVVVVAFVVVAPPVEGFVKKKLVSDFCALPPPPPFPPPPAEEARPRFIAGARATRRVRTTATRCEIAPDQTSLFFFECDAAARTGRTNDKRNASSPLLRARARSRLLARPSAT